MPPPGRRNLAQTAFGDTVFGRDKQWIERAAEATVVSDIVANDVAGYMANLHPLADAISGIDGTVD